MSAGFEVIAGSGAGSTSRADGVRVLIVRLVALITAEHDSHLGLQGLLERVSDPAAAARLRILQAFSRAHVGRMKTRLVDMGLAILPATPVEPRAPAVPLESAIRLEAGWASVLAARYADAAELARQQQPPDLSTAWVLELNCTEAKDQVRELLALVERLFPGVR